MLAWSSHAAPFYVAGEPETSDDVVTVRHPYDGREVGRTRNATPDQVERAVAAAAAVAAEAAALPAARPRRRARPRLAAGSAERADEVAAADHRRERQAAQVGPGRGRPGGVARSAGRPRRPAGSPASCSGWTPTRPATGRMARGPPLPARAGARHQRRSTSRSTWSPTRSPRRSRSARRSWSSRRRPPRCPRCCSASCWPRPTCPPGMFSVLPVPNDRAAGAGRRPAAAGGVVHRLRAGRLRDPATPCRAST